MESLGIETPNANLDVLILTPSGQDGKLAAAVLEKAGIKSETIGSVSQLSERLKEPAGCLLIAEEAITKDVMEIVIIRLSEQETWSDLPIILLSSESKKYEDTRKIVEHFGVVANITLLERPFSVITLITMTKVALRARHKQYQVQNLLLKMKRTLNIRDEFLSVASHELKTPITTIKLQTQMRNRFIKKGDSGVFSPEKTTKFIELIDKQTSRLSRLVDDMLDVSRIDNGKLTIRTEVVDLNSLVSHALEGFQAELQNKKIEISFGDNDQLEGSWDRYRIEQVVVNLLTNAIKYGDNNPIYLKSYRENGFAILEVRDEGIGIPPEDQKRIFNRFERAVLGGNISGLGLGLFICSEIVELHGGRLNVESELNHGSVFKLELPLNEGKK